MFIEQIKRSGLAQSVARRPPGLYAHFRRQLDRHTELDRDGRRAYEARRLERLLALARQAPAYAAASDWADVPLLSKPELRQAPLNWRRRSCLPVSRARTSGTTGAALEIVRSIRNVVFEQAAIDWTVAQAGLDFARDRVLVLRGDQIKHPADDQPPFWKYGDDGRTLILSANHLNARNLDAILDEARRFRPDILYAYPSAAQNLANLVEAHGASLRFGLVVTSSEMAPPVLRRRLQRTFGAVTLDYYGQAERVCFAWSREPGRYHFLGAYGRVEFEIGDAAEIVGTAFENDAQPLLRYRTGDEIDLAEGADLEAVALGLAPFAGVEGRTADVIYGPNGEVFLAMNHIPRALEQIERLQLIQTDPDRVALLVQSQDRSDGVRQAVLTAARAKIGPAVALEVDFVDAPRLTPAGKAPLVIHDWRPG